jgi:tetratricopeptide (TPR) repeat protein
MTAEQRLENVQSLLMKGEIQKARDLLDAWVKTSPDDALGLVALARLHLQQMPDLDSFKTAESLINRARKVSPKNPEVWTEWGNLALAQWQLPDAVERFKHVINELKPVGFRAHHGMIRAYVRQERFARARNAVRNMLDAGPDVAENHWMAGNVEFAAVDEVGAFERAVVHYLFAAGLDDKNPKYKGWAMMAHFAGHRYLQAEPIANALRAQDPQNSYLLVSQGIREELNADPGAAMEYYQKAVDRDWYNPWAHWCLAKILTGQGNLELIEFTAFNKFFYGPYASPKDAEEHLQAVDNVYPEFPFRAKLRPMIEEIQNEEDGSKDPIYKEKAAKFHKYMLSIKRSAPNIDWSKRKEW